MYRYIVYIGGVILSMCGISLLLSSCEEIERDFYGQGKKIPVTFSISPVSYNADQNVTRASQVDDEPETAVIPLGDGLFMQATLMPDPREPATRAVELIEGTEVCIVVYNSVTNAYITHAIDTVKTDNMAHHTFELTEGVSYNFAAYAYYNPDSLNAFRATVPGSINGTDPILPNISPSVDLLYGNRTNRTVHAISATDNDTVQIPMWHLFSRIGEVRAVSNVGMPPIEGIGDITLSTFKGNLQVATASYDSLTGIATGFEQGIVPVSYTLPAGSTWTSFSSNFHPSISTPADSFRVERSNLFEWLVFPGTETAVTFSSIQAGGKTYPDPSQPDVQLFTTFFQRLLSSRSYILRVTFTTKPDIEPGPITNGIPYVGAFWRANETGERIIRIEVDDAITVSRQWVAAVSWVDSTKWEYWNSDGILLQPGGSPDPTVNTPLATSNAESHPLIKGYTSINGYADKDHPILFRIGLQQNFAAYDAETNPTRYAQVKISFNNKEHTLYLRQGEGADYAPGQTTGARWSVYNLGDIDDPVYYPDSLVHFPSQAGYFYQWGYATGSANNTPIPRHPIDPVSGNYSGWVGGSGSNYEYTLAKACPGSHAYTVPNVLDYENMISLYWNYYRNLTWDYEASTWGYYADGFFDRRIIVNSAQGHANTAVSYYLPATDTRNRDVAYIGKIFYDLSSNASIFFPAAGLRDIGVSQSGVLANTGYLGVYWSSSPSLASSTWHFTVANTDVDNYYTFRANGFSVRCVKPLPATRINFLEEESIPDNTMH